MKPEASGSDTVLVEAADDDFEWMIRGEPEACRGLRLPPGGVDDPFVLKLVREMAEKLRVEKWSGAWMMTSGDEIVGLCSYRRPPIGREVEIGYGVTQNHRGRGHATRAVRALAAISKETGLVALLAETAISNRASARVLEKNDFLHSGTRTDPNDGEVLLWRKKLS